MSSGGLASHRFKDGTLLRQRERHQHRASLQPITAPRQTRSTSSIARLRGGYTISRGRLDLRSCVVVTSPHTRVARPLQTVRLLSRRATRAFSTSYIGATTIISTKLCGSLCPIIPQSLISSLNRSTFKTRTLHSVSDG